MKEKKRIHIIMQGVMLGTLLFITPALAQNTLSSVKTGEEGDKSWALMNFDKSVSWIGISKAADNLVSLYFEALTGNLDQSSYHIDGKIQSSLFIRQVSKNPPIFRAEIQCPDNVPLAAIKMNSHLIIAINDLRFMEGKMSLSPKNFHLVPHRLVNVSSIANENEMTATLHFNAYPRIMGYIRPSSSVIALMLEGAELAEILTEYSFKKSSIETIKLFQQTTPFQILKPVIFFDKNASFSIVPRLDQIIIQAKLPSAREYHPEEATWAQLESDAQDSEAIDQLLAGSMDSGSGMPITSDMDFPQIPEQGAAGLEQSDVIHEVKPVPSDYNVSGAIALESRSLKPDDIDGSIDKRGDADSIPWDRIVGFNIRATPIKDALRTLAISNDLNMVIVEGVEGMCHTAAGHG